MSNNDNPRILVADDDLGVIAAYRYVLEGDELGGALRGKSSVKHLEAELFGEPDGDDNNDANWRVHFVDQGEDAVTAVDEAIAKSDPFSVVFLDIRMPPGLDGFETAQQIRKIDPIVHIVFVSGFSDYTDEQLAAVAGPQHRVSFLPKPVWPTQLKSKALAICKDARLVGLCRDTLRSRKLERQAGG